MIVDKLKIKNYDTGIFKKSKNVHLESSIFEKDSNEATI